MFVVGGVMRFATESWCRAMRVTKSSRAKARLNPVSLVEFPRLCRHRSLYPGTNLTTTFIETALQRAITCGKPYPVKVTMSIGLR
jgi:hypothetical protein